MSKLLYPKGTKAYCPSCNELYFVFCTDIFEYDVCSINNIYENLGQAPFIEHQKMICMCGQPLSPTNLVFEKPIKE